MSQVLAATNAAYEVSARAGARLRSIDMLRGLAALAVVVGHAFYMWRPGPGAWLGWRALDRIIAQGYLGVPLFFVISGFCIHMPWAKRYAATGAHKIAWYSFWKRRIRRLYPPYLAALLIAMGLVLAACFLHINLSDASVYPQPALRAIGFDFLLHATMLHGLFTRFDMLGGNGAFWSLAREEYLYTLYAALLLFRRRLGLTKPVLAVAFVGLVAVAVPDWLLHGRPSPTPIANSVFALWIQWCLGMVAVEAYLGLCKLPRIFDRLWMFPLWFVVAKFSEVREMFALSNLFFGLAFFTLLNAVLRFELNPSWSRSRLGTWLANVGLFSYSLYLIHNPIRAVYVYLLEKASISPTAPVPFLIVAVLGCVAVYYGAKLFYRVFEAPFLNKKAEPYRRERIEEPAPAAAAATAV